MIQSLCKICKKINHIVWIDYDKVMGAIKVCFDCALFMDWSEGKRFVTEQNHLFIVCNTCQNKFLPKKEGAVKCSNCWKEYFAKKNAVVQVKKVSQGVLAW